METPSWLDTQLFPFQSRWIQVEGNNLHYIDEGSGPVILFAHGTPEWSFGYRDLIADLRKDFRCIAFDMLGFGLSEKPQSGEYSCEAHARRLELAIEQLHLKDITIVANDFGGSIALSYALHNADNIHGIVLFNTWMRSLKDNKHYATPAKVMNSWLGRLLYLSFNFPVNVIMPSAFGNKKLLTRNIHRHYKLALPQGQRQAAYAFSLELMRASDWWEALWMKVDRISKKPVILFWGMKDKFVPPSELEIWKRKLPHAKVVTFEDAGHFVQEEKAKEMASGIRQMFST